MVDEEFAQIWKQYEEQKKSGEEDADDAGKSEDELKEEYRDIAIRRVRLGLVLASIGESNKIEVSQEEVQRAVIEEAQRYPGQERAVVEFFQKNADALNSIRAPLFEDKVVDFILELAETTDKEMLDIADDKASEKETKATAKGSKKSASGTKSSKSGKSTTKKAATKKEKAE